MLAEQAKLSELCKQDDIPEIIARHWMRRGLWYTTRPNQEPMITLDSWRHYLRNYRHGCKQDPEFAARYLREAMESH